MKNKKGFTLVELLAVVVLICLITLISTVGVIGVKQIINNELWKSTVSLVENGAIHYGEDHSYLFTYDDICNINSENKHYCKKINVENLIIRGYLSTKEVDGSGKKIIVDNRETKDSEKYSINNFCVYIYSENELFYAKLVEETC